MEIGTGKLYRQFCRCFLSLLYLDKLEHYRLKLKVSVFSAWVDPARDVLLFEDVSISCFFFA